MSAFTVERQEIGHTADPERCEIRGCPIRPVPYSIAGIETKDGAVSIVRWDGGSRGQRIGFSVRLCDDHLRELYHTLCQNMG